ncbi:beta-glucosidase BglX [Pelagicoccus sp. SDUM812003]|uniref:beta-glucosidase BglX n=1 Tax=Pelagicoccus sp. SDUM812003 TaxID=3041267 RepID=UPI00280C5C01|nr:beta-glucosidase BglX [Pelagicoccus sp. SDUM812003]MDQ8201449.1 beta-glucosidase BglX [Pelagicoccus sp. SDUM812003]
MKSNIAGRPLMCLILLANSLLPLCWSRESYKLEDIIESLSLEEKAGQLNLVPLEGEPTDELLQAIREGKIGSLLKSNGAEQNLRIQKVAVEESASGIPILFQEDVIHGYKTITPTPLAEAASWDLELIRASAALAAREAASSGIHLTYAPMVDISRDPRWGRILEGSGEDPYLGAMIAVARVRGFQESGLDFHQNLLACAKHFAGYGATLAGRDYNISDLSERELREIHLPPFQSAIDANVSSVMSAYTSYDALPASANPFLLRTILRQEMGFRGLLMTDWDTIGNLCRIGIAKDNRAAAKMAFKAGIEMDMFSQAYLEHIPELVRLGDIDEDQLNQAVSKVLELKQKARLFDDPYAYFDKEREEKELLSDDNRNLAKDIARKSIVLLKNDNSLLPFSPDIKSIAVVGPFAKAKRDLLGWWSAMGSPEETVSIWEGLAEQLGQNVELSYAPGCSIVRFEKSGASLLPEAVNISRRADVAIIVVGEEYWMSGEGGGTASLHLPGLQEQLIAEVAATGTPVVTVVVTGKPYILTEVARHSDAIIQAWMPGTMGGAAVAEILTGAFNPSGKLPVTFPIHQGQIPIYYSYRRTSHPFDPGPKDNRYTASHRDIGIRPLYPFGYGLSYTTFLYSEIRLSSDTMRTGGSIEASVTVTNTGENNGREIVQLYISDEIASVTRPVKELKGFQLIDLNVGESQTVTFEITPDSLSFIGADYKAIREPGRFVLQIGTSSEETKQAAFTLVGGWSE